MISFLSALVVLLSLVGLWDAFYFTFAYYGRVEKARWVPEVLCAREGSNCVTVVQTPYARIFGLPNSLFGIGYYLALILWILIPSDWAIFWGRWVFPLTSLLGWVLTAAACVTVVMGFYLIYTLLKKLGTHCPLCYLAHAINAALLALLGLILFSG